MYYYGDRRSSVYDRCYYCIIQPSYYVLFVSRNKQRPITAEELEQIKNVIIYDSESGYLLRNGKRAGGPHPTGYRRIEVFGRQFYEHRIAWALYYNEDPYPLEIDHINRNRSDNVISNLRRVTVAEQNMNKSNIQQGPKPPRRTQSKAAFNRWANTTPEQRRELALHRWEVRRSKQKD